MENNNHVMADANESMERNLTRNESTIFASYGLVGAILFSLQLVICSIAGWTAAHGCCLVDC